MYKSTWTNIEFVIDIQNANYYTNNIMFELFEKVRVFKTLNFSGNCDEFAVINCYLYLETTLMDRKYWNKAVDIAFSKTKSILDLNYL